MTYEEYRMAVIAAFDEDFWNMQEDWIWQRNGDSERLFAYYYKKCEPVRDAAVKIQETFFKKYKKS